MAEEDICGGIQIDLSSAARSLAEGGFRDTPSCDHDCSYCPSAYSRNPNIGPRSFLSVEIVDQAIRTTATGIRLACGLGTIEVNLFGTPEMHPQLPEIIENTKRQKHRVTVTMTGRTATTKPSFFEQILEAQPDRIALSCDDFVNTTQQKSHEAVIAARYISNTVPILFNVVLHPDSISKAPEIVQDLQHHFPYARINAYPDQAGFMSKPSPFSNGLERQLDKTIDWLMSQNINVAYFKKYRQAGPEFFHCWEPGAARYQQIASAPQDYIYDDPDCRQAFLNCYWNRDTVGSRIPLSQMRPEDVARRITEGVAVDHSNPNTCRGCAMPRLAITRIYE